MKRVGIDVGHVLLELDARVNEKDLNGKTALGFADDRREIEAVLETHSRVRNALVIAREDNPGEKWLVIY